MTLFSVNPLTWTNLVSSFNLHPSLFILFTDFVLRKSTEQGKLEKSPRDCFMKPLPTTMPAPCTALQAAPAPSLNPQDFLKGTRLHFKHRSSSGPAWGTGAFNTETPTSFYMSWIHCPQKSQNNFFLGLRANTPGIKAAFINDSSACKTMNNLHVHNNSTSTPWLTSLPQRSAAGSQAEWYAAVGPLGGIGLWVLFFCFCYREYFSKYHFQPFFMSHFPPNMEPEFRGQDTLPQEVCIWYLWNGG